MKRRAPFATHDDQFFWDGVAAGELRLQRCAKCLKLRHPPGPMCPHCHSLEWRIERASGRGSVYSYVIPRHTAIDSGGDPVIVALIELEEGARLVSNLCEVAPDAVRNGMAVEVFFTEFEDGVRLHQFRPAGR
ncbi:MAG TPA: OB-fold domain-containing protein [Candidatus Binataceae bacterium]|nr:OB-fold domain-containing protein [Candidatus Binataceae bacterium]